GRRENGPFNGPFSLLRVGAAADWCLDSLLSASRAFWHYDYPRQALRRLQGVLGAAGWYAPRVAAGWVGARAPRSSERGVLVGGGCGLTTRLSPYLSKPLMSASAAVHAPLFHSLSPTRREP